MKVIFLDIDGVLNSEDLARRRIEHDKLWNDQKNEVYDFIDENAVKIVTDICQKYDIKLVISSSWRSWTLEDTINDFSQPRYKILHPLIKYIIGVTPRIYIEYEDGSSEHVERGIEIKDWLEKHNDIETYCIIDDDCDMLQEQTLNFVQTNFWHGLTSEHLPKIKSILKL